ncbi:MAG: lipid-A-disaccharide synthase N-terminal domain-containing protein [Rikenellaceae bacterium]|nr:lipid-A-disaccharide synthase N-terminal domain-containing protein [Rikenellaceae bacterium]
MQLPWYVIILGLAAQALFSARILVQWIASERAKKILSPTVFWKISMAASFIFCIYGWLRNDFSIIFAQLISYYIYIWNIDAKGAWKRINIFLRIILVSLPVVAALWSVMDWDYTYRHLFEQDGLPVWLIIFGTVGQIIFTLRFVYQWLYSRRRGESLLPLTFWVISLTGSLIIVTYGIMRHEYILIISHSAGILSYARNIMIGLGNRQGGLPSTGS